MKDRCVMLTNRQFSIFEEMSLNPGTYFKAIGFTKKYGVSLRSVQNDIIAVKTEMERFSNIFRIVSKVPFGTKINVLEIDAYTPLINNLHKQYQIDSSSEKKERPYKLLSLLLYCKKSISAAECEDYLYISRSTLYSDLKKLEEIVSKYSLEVVRSNSMISIKGLERDKRICLMNVNYVYQPVLPNKLISNIETINVEFLRKTLTAELIEKKYPISDVEFQNVILWLSISIKRIMNCFVLEQGYVQNKAKYSIEKSLAESIFGKISGKYLLDIPQSEIEFLAVYINNHGNLRNTEYITSDMNDFILQSLEKIKESFPTDFTHDVNLRIYLALHCGPLISRAQNNMQIKNEMLDYIKQSFPYAFDVATFFSYLLSQHYSCKIKESETAYLAIYFNKSIVEYSGLKESKKICVITNLQRSEYFLLEQMLYDKFGHNIESIAFINTVQLETVDLDQYDVFFSTENNKATESGLASKISCFPNEKEMNDIRMKIKGFNDMDDITNLFNKDLFYIKDNLSKEDIQNCIVGEAAKMYHLNDLTAETNLREEYGSTYFGNGIAILHPMHLIANDSFIGEVLLKKPIVWDSEGNAVNLVFLVCIQKNNIEAFRGWNQLSPLLFNNQFKERLKDVKCFDDFIRISREYMKDQIFEH